MSNLDATPDIFDDRTLAELGAYVREHMDENCCHGLATTLSWLRERGLQPTNEVVHWLVEQGVVCDCEVITELGDRASARLKHTQSNQ